MRNALIFAAILSTFAMSCKEAPKRRCYEYDQAEATFNELTGQILDPTFGDPRFAVAAEAFEAVPEDCRRQQQGLTIARTIRSGIAQRAAEPAPAPVVFAPPRPPTPRPASAQARQPLAKIELPTPKEEGPSKEDCADFVMLFRNSCPGACMQEDPNLSAYACWETCEGAMAILLADGDCPPVPRSPAPAQAPRAPAAPPPAAKAPEPPKPTGRSYCAYFLPDGNSQYSYCLSVPLPEAEAHCAAQLKSKNIEGTCACSDDPRFIGDRCK